MKKADPQIKIHTELQQAQNSENNIEKKNQYWKTHTSIFQNLLQSYHNPNNVVLT